MSQRSGVVGPQLRRHSAARAMGWASLVWTAACGGSPRHAGEVPDSPQVALEEQLLAGRHGQTRRANDGGLLYATEFNTTSPEALRVPYDILKLECEQHGGRFDPLAPPQKTAASLAGNDIPDAVHKLLDDADARALFGEHRCEAGGHVWYARFEPVMVRPTRRDHYGFQLYVKVSAPEAYDPNAPPGPGLPPVAAGMAAQEATAAANAQGPTPPPDSKPRAALDVPLLRPPAAGDQLLADPRPFGAQLGVDTPESLAKRLGLELAQAQACDAPGLTGLCWERPGNSEALALRTQFVALGGDRKVLAQLEVDYPANTYSNLAHVLRNLYGAPDEGSDGQQALRWSWLHSSVALTLSAERIRLTLEHKPSLDRAQLPKDAPARMQPNRAEPATPWQIQLGYEPAQSAQARLQAVGFKVPGSGCSDGDTASAPVFTRTCPLQSERMQGVRSAWARTVDIGDGHPRLAELGYQLDPAAWDETLRDLKQQYGEPIPSQGDTLQWWTGPVGITLTSAKNEPTLRYYHGRLLQFFIVAGQKQSSGGPAPQKPGI